MSKKEYEPISPQERAQRELDIMDWQIRKARMANFERKVKKRARKRQEAIDAGVKFRTSQDIFDDLRPLQKKLEQAKDDRDNGVITGQEFGYIHDKLYRKIERLKSELDELRL